MKLFEDTESSELNITPLIDVVFILLIFFMVSTSFNNKASFKIKLPKAKTGVSSKTQKEYLDISIAKSGDININGKPAKLKDIKKYAHKNKQKMAKISADEKVYHSRVIKVMDELRKSGIFSIAIETRLK